MRNSFLGILGLLLLLGGCDGIYDASIQGVVLDWDDYNDSSVVDAGINNVDVYLYLNEKHLDEDLAAWNADGKTKPESRINKKGLPETAYYQKTTTDTQGDVRGSFSFNGVMWRNLFPEFGKPGDRATLYFLFYHKDYGMVKAPDAVTVTSGVTNKLPQFRIKKSLCEVTLSGYVVDMNKKQEGSSNRLPLSNVSISIYLPLEFDSKTGAVVKNQWEKTPKYTLVTNADGRFEQKITFPARSTEKIQKCPVMVVYEKDNYSAYVLTSEAANQFSGLGGVDPVSDVEKDEKNWVMLNGESTTLNYTAYKSSGDEAVTETVGVSGDEKTQLLDIDDDGLVEVVLPVVLTYDGNSTRNSLKLNQTLFLRQYHFTTVVQGRILDSTGTTLAGSVTYSSKDNYENSRTVTTISSNQGEKPDYTYSFDYSWVSYNYPSEYAYQQIYMKAKSTSDITSQAYYLVGAAQNAIDFQKP